MNSWQARGSFTTYINCNSDKQIEINIISIKFDKKKIRRNLNVKIVGKRYQK